jgi:signal transduction histidine kinase
MTPLTLKTRIFLSSTLVAVLSVAFAVHFVTDRVAREAEAELRRGLLEAGTLVEQHHAARVETLTLLARLVADLPKLKAAVDTGDPTTVGPLAEDYKARLQADLFAITDPSGRELVVLGAPAHAGPPSPAVRTALAGHEAMTFRAGPSSGLQIVTEPIVMESGPREVMGALTVGFALDNVLAERFRRVTQSDVVLAVPGRILASTLPRAHDRELIGRAGHPGISLVDLDGNEYVMLERPLGAPGEVRAASDAPTPIALILRSRTERLRFLRTFRTAILVATLVAVVMAVLFSYGVAGTVTGPLSAITTAMREMTATGDLTRKIRLGRFWDDEDARVLAGAFNTLIDSIARFQREAALRERLSALGRLSTVIAHEVRNPLMIIKATLRTLRRPGLSARDLQEAAGDIDQEVTRLNRIVGDVLDFARPVTLSCAPIDLNALCTEAAAAAMTGEGAPAWKLSLDPRLAPVVTDGERLRTVLLNVLSNAREAVQPREAGVREPAHEARARGAAARGAAAGAHGPTAGWPPDVELRTESLADGRAAIEVQDRGMGIDPADLPHVFEPYFTTKRTGTGLGLAIAKNIVDALGGTLTAAPAEPLGARLRIELPPLPPVAEGRLRAAGRA